MTMDKYSLGEDEQERYNVLYSYIAVLPGEI